MSANGAPAAPAGDSVKTRVFWAQRPGAKGVAPLAARGDVLVGFLVDEIAKKLKLDVPLDSITLQLASEDGTLFTDKNAKDAAGSPQPVTLNSMDTIDKALEKALGRPATSEDKLRVIVDVAAPAAPPPPPLAASADGEDAGAVQRTRMRSCAVLLCRCTA